MNKIEIKISHPPEWPTKTIYEACPIVSRGTAPVYVENSTVLAIGQRCVREFGFQPEEARFHDQCSMTRVLEACKGDVLLNSTGTGTIGRSCIFNADGTYIIDGHVTLLRSDPDQLDGRWLNALLQSSQGQLHLETQCYSGSTNQVELSRERLSATLIPLPFLPEQCRIAEILDTIDEAIQKTEALISKLKAMKQGLLHDLLTRGLDKNGKLRDPKTHPEQFKHSPLGRIPKEWEIHGLDTVCQLSGGYGFPDSFQGSVEGELPFIKVSDMSLQGNERDIVNANNYVSMRIANLMGWKPFPAGAVVFAKVGAALKLNRRRILIKPTLIDNNMMAAIPQGGFDSAFLYHFLCVIDFGDFVQDGALPSVNQEQVGSIKLPNINKDEQRRIADILDAHDVHIHTEEEYRDKLKLQKKGLMHDLLTGNVRVKV